MSHSHISSLFFRFLIFFAFFIGLPKLCTAETVDTQVINVTRILAPETCEPDLQRGGFGASVNLGTLNLPIARATKLNRTPFSIYYTCNNRTPGEDSYLSIEWAGESDSTSQLYGTFPNTGSTKNWLALWVELVNPVVEAKEVTQDNNLIGVGESKSTTPGELRFDFEAGVLSYQLQEQTPGSFSASLTFTMNYV